MHFSKFDFVFQIIFKEGKCSFVFTLVLQIFPQLNILP